MNIRTLCPLSGTLLLVVGVGAAQLVASPGFTQEPCDAENRILEFEAGVRGAAASTHRRQLEALRDDLEGASCVFSGSIFNITSVSLEPSATAMPDWGRSFFSWEHGGVRAGKAGVDGSVIDRTPGEVVRARLGSASSASMVILRGDRLQVYALTRDETLVDELRRGISTTLEIEVTGIRENTVFGYLLRRIAEPDDLVCPLGRKFPPSSGFRFCPYCGGRLGAREPSDGAD